MSATAPALGLVVVHMEGVERAARGSKDRLRAAEAAFPHAVCDALAPVLAVAVPRVLAACRSKLLQAACWALMLFQGTRAGLRPLRMA